MKRLLVVLIITLIGLSISPPVQAQSSCQFTFVSNTAGTGWFSITYSADNYTMLTSIQYSNHNPFGDDIPFTITGIEANSVDIYSGSTYVSDIVVIDVADVVLSAGQHVTIKTYTPDYVQGTILPLCQTAPQPTPTPTPGATLTPLAGINNAIGRFGIQRVYTSPFEFEPIEIPTPSPAQHLDINIGVTDINKIGQIVATVFSMIDQYSILATALVIALALFVLRWLYKFVMGLPRRTEVVNASAATDYYYDRQMDNLEPDDIEERRTLKRQKSAARRLIR